MKDFDLEAARKGEPVVTRDGRKVRILDTNFKCRFCVVAAREGLDSEELIQADKNGRYISNNMDSRNDLFMAEVTHYANVYKTNSGTLYIGMVFDTAEEVERSKVNNTDNYIKTIEFAV